MYYKLTEGSIPKNLILFALPMIAGNLLQQIYNITDTLIVGQFIGVHALGAVGSAYALMVFLTSIFIGLSMGIGSLFSIYYGAKNDHALKTAIVHAFFLVIGVALTLTVLSYLLIHPILTFLNVPTVIVPDLKTYLMWILSEMVAVAFYNFFASLLRAVGNSTIPLYFLAFSAITNILLDSLFVIVFQMGIAGAAIATVIAQYLSAIGITLYVLTKCKSLLPTREHFYYDKAILKSITKFSLLTCLQQSCMNFGILLIQRLVNSFGAVTMAGFGAGVKIDTFAYLPVQDFGNAFSTFVAQNYGAGKKERLRDGIKIACLLSTAFSLVASLFVCLFAKHLMMVFVKREEIEVILSGIHYLRIEGAFYVGIGILFLLYGLYRSMNQPLMSLVLTIISLGLRVVLAYSLAPLFHETGIWISIPIGWFIADAFGFYYYFKHRSVLMKE